LRRLRGGNGGWPDRALLLSRAWWLARE
jgi:hypothetical protein